LIPFNSSTVYKKKLPSDYETAADPFGEGNSTFWFLSTKKKQKTSFSVSWDFCFYNRVSFVRRVIVPLVVNLPKNSSSCWIFS
jgi:hypothetical protein